MDIFTPPKRSRVMARVRGQNTRVEAMLVQALSEWGLHLLKNVKSLPGSPDIVLPQRGAVIFVNGCFWHAHEHCRHFKLPATRTGFWKKKLWKNKVRDMQNTYLLRKSGWKVLTVWECSLKEDFEGQLKEIVRWLERE